MIQREVTALARREDENFYASSCMFILILYAYAKFEVLVRKSIIF